MRTCALLVTLTLGPIASFSQEQAVYLTTLGRTLFVVSYDHRFAQEFAVQGGIGQNNLDRTSSTTVRFGASYLRGTEHMLELLLFVDIWTKFLNPIAREDTFFGSFLGYRYQPGRGFTFRVGINPLRLNEHYFDADEWFQNVLQASIGYSF